MPGVYDVQTTFFRVRGVFTNSAPMDAYRGAGRPEAIYVIERLMDWSARDLGVEPVALRRKSFIPREAFPYRSAAGELYDVGDFELVLDRALAEADVAGFPARKAESAAEGRLRGIGLAYYIESILGSQDETTTIAFADDGMVELHVGTQSNGQGHETAFAQILAERSGVPFERIRFVQGDSDRIAKGGGTGGSRSTTMQGSSIRHAADAVIERFRPLAEEELEVAGADLVFEEGAFRVAGTDREVGLVDLAEAARRRGKTELLSTTREFTVPGRSYPNGAHFRGHSRTRRRRPDRPVVEPSGPVRAPHVRGGAPGRASNGGAQFDPIRLARRGCAWRHWTALRLSSTCSTTPSAWPRGQRSSVRMAIATSGTARRTTTGS